MGNNLRAISYRRIGMFLVLVLFLTFTSLEARGQNILTGRVSLPLGITSQSIAGTRDGILDQIVLPFSEAATGTVNLSQDPLDRDVQFFVLVSEIDDQDNVILEFPRVSGTLPAGQTSAPFQVPSSAINENGRYVVTYGCELATDCSDLIGIQFLTGQGNVVFTLEDLAETTAVSGASLLNELGNLVLQEGRAVDVQLAAPSGTPLETNVFAFARFESVLDSGQRRSLFGVRLSLPAGELVSDPLPFVLPPIPQGASYSVSFFCDGADDVTPCDGLVRRGLFSPNGTQLSEDDADTLISPSDFPDTVVLELVPGNNANFSITGPDSVTGSLLFDIEVDLLDASGQVIDIQRISTIDVSRFENLATSLPLNFSAVLPAFPDGETGGSYRIRYACTEEPVVVRLGVPIGDISCDGLVADRPSYIVFIQQDAIPDPISLPFVEPFVQGPDSGFSTRLNDTSQSLSQDFQIYRISPDGSRVIYLSEIRRFSEFDLFSVPIPGGIPTKIAEGVLPINFSTLSNFGFKISPDGSRVVYRGRDVQAGDNVGLFSVPITGGTPIRLHGDFTGDQESSVFSDRDFEFSPDGTRVVYRVEASASDTLDEGLFSVPVTGGEPIRLNGDLPEAGRVKAGFKISSDSTRVIYVADQSFLRVDEIFSASITGGESVRLNPEFSPVGEFRQVGEFDITPDASRVVYEARQFSSNSSSGGVLFSVPTRGGSAIRLSQVGSEVFFGDANFLITPNGESLVYLANASRDPHQLFSVPITGGASIRLDQGEDDNFVRIFRDFEITPDGSRVVYVLNNVFSNESQLLSVQITGGESIVLNQELNPSEVFREGRVSPDGTRVIYLTRLSTGDANERLDRLFSVPILGGDSVMLNDNSAFFRNSLSEQQLFSPDGSRVIYVSDQSIEGVNELFSVPITGGTPIRLNSDLVLGGDVRFFPIAPEVGANSDFVVYIADQNVDEQFELFSSPILGRDAFDGVVSLPDAPLDRDIPFFVSLTEVNDDGSFTALPSINGTIFAGQTSAGFNLGDVVINENATYAVTYGCLSGADCGDLLGFHFLSATGTVFAAADASDSLVPSAELSGRLRNLVIQSGTEIDVQVASPNNTPLPADVTVFARFESVLASGERQSLFGFRFDLLAGDLTSNTESFTLPPLPDGASYAIRFFCDDADANLPCDDILRGGLFSPNGTRFSVDDPDALIAPAQVPDSVVLELVTGTSANFSITGPDSVNGPLLFDIEVDLLDESGQLIENQRFASIDVTRFAELADGFPVNFSTVIPAFPADQSGGTYRVRYACTEDPVIVRLSVPIDDLSCAGFVASSPAYSVSFAQDANPETIELPFFETAITGNVALDQGPLDNDTDFYVSLTEVAGDGSFTVLPSIIGRIPAGEASAQFQIETSTINENADYLVQFGCVFGSQCDDLLGIQFLTATGNTVFSLEDVRDSLVPGAMLANRFQNLVLQTGTEVNVQVAIDGETPLDADVTVFVRFESVPELGPRVSLFGFRFSLPAGDLISETLPFVLPPIPDGASYSIRSFCDDADATLPCDGILRGGLFSPDGTQFSDNDVGTLIDPNQIPDSVVLTLLAGTTANFSIVGPESAVGPLLFDIEVDLLNSNGQILETQRFASIDVERFATLADAFPLEFSTVIPRFPASQSGGSYRIRYACSEESVITRLSVPIADISCQGFLANDPSYEVSFPQGDIPEPIVLQFVELAAIAPDAFEIDDALEQAGELSVEQPRVHSLHQVGDEDWTRFTLSQASPISLVTLVRGDSAETSTLELTLFDEFGNQIASDLDALSNAEFENPLLRAIDIASLNAGDYLVRVRANSPSILVDSYSLELTGPSEQSIDDSLCFPIVIPNGGASIICL